MVRGLLKVNPAERLKLEAGKTDRGTACTGAMNTGMNRSVWLPQSRWKHKIGSKLFKKELTDIKSDTFDCHKEFGELLYE